jgi:hypothetical protein
MSCDYNGWNDAPEGEREALDAYEATAEKARVAVGSGSAPPQSQESWVPSRCGSTSRTRNCSLPSVPA